VRQNRDNESVDGTKLHFYSSVAIENNNHWTKYNEEGEKNKKDDDGFMQTTHIVQFTFRPRFLY